MSFWCSCFGAQDQLMSNHINFFFVQIIKIWKHWYQCCFSNWNIFIYLCFFTFAVMWLMSRLCSVASILHCLLTGMILSVETIEVDLFWWIDSFPPISRDLSGDEKSSSMPVTNNKSYKLQQGFNTEIICVFRGSTKVFSYTFFVG